MRQLEHLGQGKKNTWPVTQDLINTGTWSLLLGCTQWVYIYLERTLNLGMGITFKDPALHGLAVFPVLAGTKVVTINTSVLSVVQATRLGHHLEIRKPGAVESVSTDQVFSKSVSSEDQVKT